MRCFTERFALQLYILTTLTGVSLTADISRRKCLLVKPSRRQYSIQRLDNYHDDPPVCDRFGSPNAPSSVELGFGCDEGAVMLSWNAKRDSLGRLGGFLIKVTKSIDGPRTSIHYHQVNVTGKQRKSESFSYRCIDIKHVHNVEVQIWSLSRNMKKCHSVFRSLVTDRKELQTRCDVEMCLCKSNVAIKPFIEKADNSLRGRISLTNTPTGTAVRILLQQENGTVRQNWTTTWQENMTSISVRAEHVPTGTYFFRVVRYCKHKSSMPSTCGISQTPVIRSEAIKVNNTKIEGDHGSVDALLVLLVIFASLFLVLVVAIIWFMTSSLGLLKCCTKRQHRFTNARRIYHQMQGADARKRVALIFAKDSSAHCKRVHSLKTELYKNGVEAVAIDEQTNMEMFVNWIDVGERIPSQFDILLFIMSPILYELCHRDGTGILEVTRGGHTVHRLPAAVLHALRVNPYYKGAKVPKAFVVSLDRVPQESNPMIKTFMNEFKSVFHPKPIFVNDMSNGLKRLLKKIHVRSPLVV